MTTPYIPNLRVVDAFRFTRNRDEYFLFTTAAIARYILDTHNEGNRTLTDSTFDAYARAMQDGRWYDANDLPTSYIMFDVNGRLLDRQHTLVAVERSGKGQWFRFAFGLKPDVIAAIDQGRNRTLGDFIAIHYKKDTPEAKRMGTRSTALKYLLGSHKSKTVPSDFEQLFEVFERGLIAAEKNIRPGFGNPAVVAGFVLGYAAAPMKVSEAMRSLSNNDGLVKGSALWFLNQWVDNGFPAGRKGGKASELVRTQKSALALAYHLEGRETVNRLNEEGKDFEDSFEKFLKANELTADDVKAITGTGTPGEYTGAKNFIRRADGSEALLAARR